MFFHTECFSASNNQFEQFCINYSNEKIQNFCTQRPIRDEQNWYKNEGIELPEIPFPGNDVVLGKYFMIFIQCTENSGEFRALKHTYNFKLRIKL